MAEDHPAALTAPEHHAPPAVLGRLEIGLVFAGRWRARPELVRAIVLDQQRPGPGDAEALRAAEPRAARVVQQEAVMHADGSHLLRRQCGAEAWQHRRHRAVTPVTLCSEAG